MLRTPPRSDAEERVAQVMNQRNQNMVLSVAVCILLFWCCRLRLGESASRPTLPFALKGKCHESVSDAMRGNLSRFWLCVSPVGKNRDSRIHVTSEVKIYFFIKVLDVT